MAYIKVDHSQFEKTATTIETYVINHKKNMQSINQSVISLNSDWSGKDYAQLRKEWQEINSSESTSGKMIKSLENYADYLRFAANKYKSAQSAAINRANSLPMW